MKKIVLSLVVLVMSFQSYSQLYYEIQQKFENTQEWYWTTGLVSLLDNVVRINCDDTVCSVITISHTYTQTTTADSNLVGEWECYYDDTKTIEKGIMKMIFFGDGVVNFVILIGKGNNRKLLVFNTKQL